MCYLGLTVLYVFCVCDSMTFLIIHCLIGSLTFLLIDCITFVIIDGVVDSLALKENNINI